MRYLANALTEIRRLHEASATLLWDPCSEYWMAAEARVLQRLINDSQTLADRWYLRRERARLKEAMGKRGLHWPSQ